MLSKPLGALEPVWDELYPAEQGRILRLLIERIDVEPDGISVTLHAAGIRSLVAELADQEAPTLARPNPCWRPQNSGRARASRGRHSDHPLPLRLQRRGGRKLIMTPEGVAPPARKLSRDETLVKALVRAHRWRRRIESGQARSITDLAEQEGVTDAHVSRLLPLTCLAPDIVEAILDGWQPRWLRLAEELGNGPLVWCPRNNVQNRRRGGMLIPATGGAAWAGRASRRSS